MSNYIIVCMYSSSFQNFRLIGNKAYEHELTLYSEVFSDPVFQRFNNLKFQIKSFEVTCCFMHLG